MEAVVNQELLKNTFCRLCSQENKNGISIFSKTENEEILLQLINKYLPLQVKEDDEFPKTICPGCHIQLEATRLFMDLILEGQEKLRDILRSQQNLLFREAKQRLQLEEALKAHNPNSCVETYAIHTDETGEKYIIQIYSEGPLFSPEHELVLRAEGLEKPKRKRGRPPKPHRDSSNKDKNYQTEWDESGQSTESKNEQPKKDDENGQSRKNENEKSEDISKESTQCQNNEPQGDGRQKRKRKVPVKYEGVVHGKELDCILKRAGVIDEPEAKQAKNNETPQTEEIIGRAVAENGEDLGQPVFQNRRTRPRLLRRGSAKTTKHKCNICQKSFLHIANYTQHLKSHKVKYSCETSECAEISEDKTIIEKHQSETGHKGIKVIEMLGDDVNTEPMSTDIPNTDDTTKENFRESDLTPEQNNKEVESNNVICEICSKNFSCRRNYEVHLRAVHSAERRYKCDVCDKAFAYANSLKIHHLSHLRKDAEDGKTKLPEYKCEQCDKIFHHPSSLCYHKDTEHANGRKFVCSTCNREFKHRQLLQRHQLVHTDERPFSCPRCSQSFKTKANLMNHETVHTGVKKFMCPKCGQNFSHRTSLSLHLRTHDGHKPHECDICQKKFSQRGNLLEHKRIHTGEKPYKCDTCDKSFTTSSQYKLHAKRHTGEKPWQCEYCSRSFLHKDTWKTHVRRHLNERPYKCKFCTSTFTEPWAAKRHERMHTGEKPYKCSECDRNFADSFNMVRHKKRVHFINENVEDKSDLEENNQQSEGVVSILGPTNSSELQTVSFDNNMELRQVVDQDGNMLSLTTPDGHQVPIVTSGDEKFQGVLPDGSLVSIDLIAEPEKTDAQLKNEFLDNIQLLTNSVIIDKNEEEKLNADIQFLTEDGKVCFITAYDENELLFA